MNGPLALLCFVSVAPSVALGATVTFDPPVLEISPSGVTTGTFQVTIADTDSLTSFDAVDMVIGSFHVQLTDFELAPEFVAMTEPFNLVSVPGPGVYPSDIKFGGFSVDASWKPPALMGTLSIDAAGLESGEYTILVKFGLDGQSQIADGIPVEGLSGVARVRVGPADCNANGIADPCEVSCQAPNNSCLFVPGCGTASDCNANGIPDDCEAKEEILRFSIRCDGDGTLARIKTLLPEGSMLTLTNSDAEAKTVVIGADGRGVASWAGQVGTPQVCISECHEICRTTECP